jgi:serine/threonine-protein kinase PpkA
MGDRLAFALVAYRSSTRKTPGLEYTTRVVSDFVPATQRQRFDRAVASVQEAKVSSHAFNEDAYAGLITALNELNWEPYHGRLIFLVTDAGALRTGDPYASTDVNGPELANLAQAKHVKIMALHMKTPAGKRSGFDNHASAAMQYQALTRQQDAELKDLYFPLDAPSAAKGQEQMDRVVKDVSRQMVKMIRHTAHGKKLPKPQDKPSQQPDDAARKAEVLGYALQLDFLGKRQGVRAPRVRRAWVADKDLTNLANPAFQVCVLLSKTQLSDLQKRLKVLVEETQRTKRTGAKDLFESILSATASFSRDPKSFTRNPEADLQELGVLGEYLEDLPYKSRVMTMTQDDWYRMSVGEQQAFVENLKSKIAAYRRYHDDTDNWESFGSQRPGDALYRVPLSMLP